MSQSSRFTITSWRLFETFWEDQNRFIIVNEFNYDSNLFQSLVKLFSLFHAAKSRNFPSVHLCIFSCFIFSRVFWFTFTWYQVFLSNSNNLQSSSLGLWTTLIVSLQRGKIPTNECPRYDTKPSDDETPVMMALWKMRSTSSLSSHWGPLWPGVAAPARILSMCLIELFES